MPNVRFGSLADILTSPRHVRFTPNNGRWAAHPSQRLVVGLSVHGLVRQIRLFRLPDLSCGNELIKRTSAYVTLTSRVNLPARLIAAHVAANESYP